MTRHHEEKYLPFSPVQMFDLVADVARYPEFLPWTAAARIRSRTPIFPTPSDDASDGASQGTGSGGGEVMEADLVISFKLFREKFGSRVTLLPQQRRILTEYLEGPFRHLKSVWSFEEGTTADGKPGCKVTFDVDFEFRNAILSGVIGLVFNEAMTRVVRAFETRAHALYDAKSR